VGQADSLPWLVRLPALFASSQVAGFLGDWTFSRTHVWGQMALASQGCEFWARVGGRRLKADARPERAAPQNQRLQTPPKN